MPIPTDCQIMLIDDDFVSHIITRHALEPQMPGVQISQFTRADLALKDLSSEAPPQAIILDINLPKMNAWEFLGILGERGLEIPTFILTFSLDDQDRLQARQFRQVKGFFNKPLNQKNINHIAEFLEKSSKGG